MIPFHRLLIATAILFSAGFAAWAYVGYAKDGGAVELGLAVFFTLCAVAFAYYLKNLKRFLGR